VKAGEVVKKLMKPGRCVDQPHAGRRNGDADCAEFGYNVESVSFDVESAIEVVMKPQATRL